MRTRLLLVLGLLGLLLVALGPGALRSSPAHAAPPARNILPFLPVNPSYASIKAALDTKAPRGGASFTPSVGPAVFVNAQGAGTSGNSPSDSNGAISPDEYVETVNFTVSVYDRALNQLSTNDLTVWSSGACNTGDPVIMYSAGDQRFYVTCITSVGGYRLSFGWSKGNKPSANGSDWCFYSSSFGGRYGSNLPDYPKLGDTSQLLMMGVNVFKVSTLQYIGSDVAVVQKPPKGPLTDCSFQPRTTTFQNLLNKDGTQASTPNPMKQADALNRGVVIANEDPGGGFSSHLTAYQVSVVNGVAKISAPVDEVVPAYAYPPNAPQKGTDRTLDTLDARLMSGWLAKDPAHGNRYCAWTGHTVAASTGGLGAEFRWYEFCAPSGTMVQSGIVQLSDRYVFMGAISPDRNAVTGHFGNKWLATVNTSSSNMYVTVSAASSSGLTDVYSSTGPDTDFSCYPPYGPPCRWGDYSGASPDPASTSAGQVWGTAMMSIDTTWGSWNFGGVP